MTPEEIELKQLHDYAQSLMEAIKGGFKSYDLPFEWISAWSYPDPNEDTDPIAIYSRGAYKDNRIHAVINLNGINDDIMSEMQDSDYDLLKKFVIDIANNFLKQNRRFEVQIYELILEDDDDIHSRPNQPGIWLRLDLRKIN